MMLIHAAVLLASTPDEQHTLERNADPQGCHAWALLHVYKTGGTTFRQFASTQYATAGYLLPGDMAPKLSSTTFELDPDVDRVMAGRDGPQSLLDSAIDGPRPLNIFIEHHSAPPNHLDVQKWRRSEFCSVCSCTLHVNLRKPEDYYRSYLLASGPARISDSSTWDDFANAWIEDRPSVRGRAVNKTADSFADMLGHQCSAPSSNLTSLLGCLGLSPGTAPDALGYDVYGRVDHEGDAFAAVMGAFGIDPAVARETATSGTHGATTDGTGIELSARSARVVDELVAEAVHHATIDHALFAAAFPEDEPVRLRAGSAASANYKRALQARARSRKHEAR